MRIGVIGSRELPESFRAQVSGIVQDLIARGYYIHTGGALGADAFALEAVISADSCSQAVVFSPWVSVSGFPVAVQPAIRQLIAYGGQVDWGVFRLVHLVALSLRGCLSATVG